MIRDAKMTSNKYVDIVIEALFNERSDGTVEKVIDEVDAAIDAYTPEKYREELNSRMFKFIYEWIGKCKDESNRLTILKNKLLNFATSEEHKKVIISWKAGADEGLKGIEMSGAHKWRTVAKAFTLSSLSLEEK